MGFFGDDKKINVIAQIVAKAGCEDAVRAMLTSLVEPSRKEKGCKQYHLHEDKKKLGSFWTYEEWASEAALDEHLLGARQMLAQAEPLMDGELKLMVLEHLV